jgi:hypothetical protein
MATFFQKRIWSPWCRNLPKNTSFFSSFLFLQRVSAESESSRLKDLQENDPKSKIYSFRTFCWFQNIFIFHFFAQFALAQMPQQKSELRIFYFISRKMIDGGKALLTYNTYEHSLSINCLQYSNWLFLRLWKCTYVLDTKN